MIHMKATNFAKKLVTLQLMAELLLKFTKSRLTRTENPIILETKIKAGKKRSRQLSLTERNVRRLEDISRKRLLKVALEPGG